MYSHAHSAFPHSDTATATPLRPPVISLLWPLSVIVFLGVDLYLLSGEVLYPHGPSAYLILFALLWGGIALAWELVAVPMCLYRIARTPALRSRVNLLAVVAGALYIAAAVGFALNLYLGSHRA